MLILDVVSTGWVIGNGFEAVDPVMGASGHGCEEGEAFGRSSDTIISICIWE